MPFTPALDSWVTDDDVAAQMPAVRARIPDPAEVDEASFDTLTDDAGGISLAELEHLLGDQADMLDELAKLVLVALLTRQTKGCRRHLGLSADDRDRLLAMTKTELRRAIRQLAAAGLVDLADDGLRVNVEVILAGRHGARGRVA